MNKYFKKLFFVLFIFLCVFNLYSGIYDINLRFLDDIIPYFSSMIDINLQDKGAQEITNTIFLIERDVYWNFEIFSAGIIWTDRELLFIEPKDIKIKTDTKLHKGFSGPEPIREPMSLFSMELVRFILPEDLIEDLRTTKSLTIQFNSSPIDISGANLSLLKEWLWVFNGLDFDDMKYYYQKYQRIP